MDTSPLPSAPSTILVTGATGTQGQALISSLVSLNSQSNSPQTLKIRALVRDASSSKAQLLLQFAQLHTSIDLVQGDFTSTASLIHALAPSAQGHTVSAIFLNTSPTFGNPEDEVRHASAVLDAATQAKVKHVVYSSVVGIADPETLSRIGGLPSWTSPSATSSLHPADIPSKEAVPFRSPFFLHGEHKIASDAPTARILQAYFGAKAEIEYRVKAWAQEGGAEGAKRSWTILRPAWFMTNFLPPQSRSYFPELQGPSPVLRSAMPPQARMMLVDPVDIGAVAARAVLDPAVSSSDASVFASKTINVGSQAVGLAEVAKALSEAAGVEVEVEQVGEEEAAREARGGNVQREAQGWNAGLQNCFEPGDLADVIGRQPRSFREFLEGRKEELRASFQG